MDAFRPDRLLDWITSTRVVVGALWLGLAAITITLLVLMQTRWGQSRPLRKCVVLSLLAHLLLVGYATTVQIVASSPLESQEPTVRVSLADDPVESPKAADDLAVAEKPWESFASSSPAAPTPLEPARAEATEIDELKRQPEPDMPGLTAEPELENYDPLEAARPEPPAQEALPDDAAAEAPPAGKPAEPIRAPSAQRSDGPQAAPPAGPQPERQAPDPAPGRQPERPAPSGATSSLVEQPQPEPTMVEAPSSPDPQDSLAGMADVLTRPSQGKPAEQHTGEPPESPRQPGPAVPAESGPAETASDHLRPPVLAGQEDGSSVQEGQTVSLPMDSPEIGPALLPVLRRGSSSHDVPDIYRLRVAPDRWLAARQMGATPQSEDAVQAALKWLVDNQEPDGHWSAQAHGGGRELKVAGRDRESAGIRADTGMTGLALLAFLAAGHTHKDGAHQAVVQRGLQYLIGQQARDGGLGGRATTYAYMYCHAMATFALSEAYGMTGDPSLRVPVRRAVARTLAGQNGVSGGWRYYPGDPGDTSQLGWQLMALKSAELAGIPLPGSARRGALRFLKSVASGDHDGLAAYRPGERVTRSMTAEALACRQFLGLPPDYSAAREAADYLLAELPGDGARNLYYWYYGTLSLFQLQGGHWERWNLALQNTLVNSQQKDGRLAGSWNPDTVWGGYGGRVYSTALATLCLEVYYRFLPLYVEVASVPLPRR